MQADTSVPRSQGHIAVVGSANIDFVMKMSRLPERDESVTNAEFIQAYGGKGANQAVAAARAGSSVYFVACVGDDPNASPMVDSYQTSGVDTRYVISAPGVPTGCALIMIGEGGHNYLSVAPGANYELTPERIDAAKDAIVGAAYVLMQYEIRPETASHVIETASAAGVPVIWNLAPAREFDRTLLKSIDILVVNEPEAGTVTGIAVTDIDTGRRAAESIVDLGARNAVVTMGASGSVLATAGSSTAHIPAFPVTPVDTTAAGDTYCGCLAVALTEGRTMAEAVRFASAAAALAVRKLGAQPSTPWRADIDSFLEENTR